MILRALGSFVVGTAFFTVLPIYAPFVVLQADGIPRFMAGLVASAIAGVVLNLLAGHRKILGVPFVAACALTGVVLYTATYAIPTSGLDGGLLVSIVVLPMLAFAYMGIPGSLGAALLGLVRLLVEHLREIGTKIRTSFSRERRARADQVRGGQGSIPRENGASR